MKKNLRKSLGLATLLLAAQLQGFAQTTGPSSTQPPYLNATIAGGAFTSIITTKDSVGSYKFVGTPDGLGAFDNGNGTFTLLVNHEFGNTAGAVHAHGQKGTFVSRLVINKSTLAVVSGADQMQRVFLWNPATSSYIAYNNTFPSASTAFARFCSGDLAAPTAFYNKATGKGTKARIYMNGEENGTEGRAMAHIVSGPNNGDSYELPWMGKCSFENVVACPRSSDTTILIGLDDATPGQVYVYVGVKSTVGTDIEKAGLTGGKLYGVAVTGLLTESNATAPAANSPFTLNLVDTGAIQNMTGAAINTASNNVGITSFLRPEDGAWDKYHPGDFYFATTNAFGANSRLWRLRFTNPGNPTLGGTITAVLDGTEGQQMMDNITIDNSGHILIVEDVGNNAHIGKMWQYSIATDSLVQIAAHDSSRFFAGGANFLTQDEEASGPIDAQEVLGAGKFLVVDQAHYSIAGDYVEGGQLMAYYNPATFNNNPEIDLAGNAISIVNGDSTASVTDNTDFGTVNMGTSLNKTLVIRNAGPGKLNVSSINITGANAAEFALVTLPAFPVSINANDSLLVTVAFQPTAAVTRNATFNIVSNDFDETEYSVSLKGLGKDVTGIATTTLSSFVKLYPNPTGDAAIIAMNLKKQENIAISVVDLQGKIVIPATTAVFEAGEQKTGINTSALSNGVYFVQVSNGTESTKIRMVIMH